MKDYIKCYYIIYGILAILLFSCNQKKNIDNNSIHVRADSVVANQISKKDSTLTSHPKVDNPTKRVLTELEKKAYNDIKNGKMKYYYFGPAYPNKALVDILKKHNVKIIVKNCILNSDSVQYNNIILNHIK